MNTLNSWPRFLPSFIESWLTILGSYSGLPQNLGSNQSSKHSLSQDFEPTVCHASGPSLTDKPTPQQRGSEILMKCSSMPPRANQRSKNLDESTVSILIQYRHKIRHILRNAQWNLFVRSSRHLPHLTHASLSPLRVLEKLSSRLLLRT